MTPRRNPRTMEHALTAGKLRLYGVRKHGLRFLSAAAVLRRPPPIVEQPRCEGSGARLPRRRAGAWLQHSKEAASGRPLIFAGTAEPGEFSPAELVVWLMN